MWGICVVAALLLAALARIPLGRARPLGDDELRRIRRCSEAHRREETLPFV